MLHVLLNEISNIKKTLIFFIGGSFILLFSFYFFYGHPNEYEAAFIQTLAFNYPNDLSTHMDELLYTFHFLLYIITTVFLFTTNLSSSQNNLFLRMKRTKWITYKMIASIITTIGLKLIFYLFLLTMHFYFTKSFPFQLEPFVFSTILSIFWVLLFLFVYILTSNLPIRFTFVTILLIVMTKYPINILEMSSIKNIGITFVLIVIMTQMIKFVFERNYVNLCEEEIK